MVNDLELYHHGIKGMKWGVRRYQNKDGSLTKAGQKRYNKEMERLEAEKKKLKETAKTRSAAQAKKDKMDKLKSEVEDLKNGKDTSETPADKRTRLLKSTDPKELYKDRDALTTNELNERLNRIDTEARLQSKATADQAKTGYDAVMGKMDKSAKTIRTVTNLYKSVDEAYSTTANSTIGKMVAKKLGIDVPKNTFNYNDVMNKVAKNDMTVKELQEAANATNNLRKLYDYKNSLGSDGKPTSKNNNGRNISESDVEDMINRILDDRESMK